MTKLPTPTTQDGKNNGGPSQFERNTKPLNAQVLEILPTPQVDDSKNTGHNQDRRTTLASEVWATQQITNWGKFEPAIRRWEQTLGITAPAPTKPDGKDDQHRLSSEFTEWMMGLEPGWITDCGLTRNEELKAAGNGVVPQQAELALRILLGFDIPKALERERERES
jgi:DNA (cytosine-5)-methyltransferase 1